MVSVVMSSAKLLNIMHCKINLVGFLIVLIKISVVICVPNIFEEVHRVCEYSTKDNVGRDYKLELINQFWNASGSGRNAGATIYVSPCGNSLPHSLGCAANAAACMINFQNYKKSILNAGEYFKITSDDEHKFVLKSVNGKLCDQSSGERFTTIIHFECHPYSKITPKFLYKDECELHIQMINPTCTPMCTTRINGVLLDLKSLQALGTLEVTEPTTNKLFRLSFCKTADGCDANMAGCELTSGTSAAIGQLAYQHFTVNHKTNDLVIKSHTGTTKRNRINLEVQLSCKWNVQGIDNLKYLVPTTQGRNFKFSGESSVACIKLPQNCVIVDETDDYLIYNLTVLNKRNGHWRVANVSNGYIILNLCSPLHISSTVNACSDQFSQVCYFDGKSNFTNLGSISHNSHVVNGIVKMTFMAGSMCSASQSATYRTEIDFLCSPTEKGPVLQDINSCTYNIRWETPAACSKLFAKGDNCLLHDITGNINLNELHKSIDRIHTFSQTSFLRYNLCGSINQPCDNKSHVSACYIKNNREHVVGFANKFLTRDDTHLRLELQGDNCEYKTKSVTHVYFHCNSVVSPDGSARVNMIKEDCAFEINIDSPLACAPSKISKCEVYDNNTFYNLTSLSQNDNPYSVRGDDSNSVYILNVCQSIFNRDSLCPSDSGACLKNLTEMNMKYKYLPVGRVEYRSTPIVDNGELVIQYHSGAYCPKAKSLHHTTIIRFTCYAREEGPRFLKRDDCSHEFFWRTPTACGKRILSTRFSDTSCNYTYPGLGKKIDLSSINKILEIKIQDESYKFSLCEKNYTHCFSNGTNCSIFNTSINLKLPDNAAPYLEYHLGKTNLTGVHINLICDPSLKVHNFAFKNIKDHIIAINLFTNLSCLEINDIQFKRSSGLNATKKIDMSKITYTTGVIPENLNKKGFTNKQLLVKNCFIKNDESEGIMFLKHIKPFSVTSSNGNVYSFAMHEQSSDCNGYVCKNHNTFISNIDSCPAYQFNTTNSIIKLIYTKHDICNEKDFFISEIWLKCKHSLNEQPIISTESKCNVIATYPIKEICPLFKHGDDVASSTGLAIGLGSLALVILLVLIIVGAYIYIKRHKKAEYGKVSDRTFSYTNKKQVAVYWKDTES